MTEKPIQHYRVTLEQAKRDYKDGLLTATGLVYYAIAIMRPIGQKLRIKDIRTFISDLGINKTTFYRAISKLKLKDLLDWEATEGLDVWASLSKGIASLPYPEAPPSIQEAKTLTAVGEWQTCNSELQIGDSELQIGDSELQIGDSELQIGDSELQIGDSELQIGDSEASKPALGKGSITSPDITDIYQIFLISLSNSERENFEIFSRKAVDMLPSKPVLPDKWIATHHQELYRRYRNSTKQETKPEAIALPSDEQMAKLQELKDTGKIKNFYPNSQTGSGTIVVDTGCALLFWWEFFEVADLRA